MEEETRNENRIYHSGKLGIGFSKCHFIQERKFAEFVDTSQNSRIFEMFLQGSQDQEEKKVFFSRQGKLFATSNLLKILVPV